MYQFILCLTGNVQCLSYAAVFFYYSLLNFFTIYNFFFYNYKITLLIETSPHSEIIILKYDKMYKYYGKKFKTSKEGNFFVSIENKLTLHEYKDMLSKTYLIS